jgi:pSer/pThr/pTyr-binding forkhead associated (FHA) protein
MASGWPMMGDVLGNMTEFDATITGNAHILRRQKTTRRHSLEQFEGDGAPRVITLAGDEMVIGRAPDAHVRLTSKRASRQHAFLRPRGTDCMLFDNDSHNGVYLNGVKVYSAVLRDGDVIQVADSIFVYSED